MVPPDSIAHAADTIHALSSGAPPAGIAVIRVSGPAAGDVLDRLTTHPRPAPRRATLRALRDPERGLLDRAMVLWLPGPASVTGEDVVELHVHGGRAVVDAVLGALGRAGSRMAEPGEFTRRALFNGRLRLDEVEGLADLLAAETEAQRREALSRASGALGRMLDRWSARLLEIAAAIEAAIDHDEVDAGENMRSPVDAMIAALGEDIKNALAAPAAERLRDGIRVVIAGPPNAGKSTLFNAIVGHDAAIVSPIPGTTRDILERPVSIAGIPFLLCDSAGIRAADDPVEEIGVQRALAARRAADIVIDLSDGSEDGKATIAVSTKADIVLPRPATLPISAATGLGLPQLIDRMLKVADGLLPRTGEVALDRRYRDALKAIIVELDAARESADELIIAEHVRHARAEMDRLTGRAGIEDVLDALFGRFCLGK